MNEIITKYLQGEAKKEEKKQLLTWLQESEENKKLFSETRDIWLVSGKGPGFGPEYKEKAFKRFAQNVQAHEAKQKRFTLYSFRYIAAAIFLVLISLGIGYYMGQRTDNNNYTAIAMNHFLMGEDSKGSIILPDGTVAWLHGNSKLSYPEEFASDFRKVQLEGEAYFEVVENKKAPFYVETEDMTVNVLGTRFNMKNYNYQPTTETTLLSGKVEVLFPSTGQRVLLEPNQKIVWNKATRNEKLSQVNAADYIVWINDRLVFTNEKLSTILFKMERWYNIEIHCDKKIDMEQRLSFTIRREAKDEIFKLLGMIAPLRYTIENEKVIIQPK